MPANGKKKILLIIPIYERASELTSLLSSINRLRLDNLELTVIVIDDGSPNPISSAVQIELKNATLSWYRHEVPSGPGYCRNLGGQITESDYLWFLDSDTEVIKPNALVHMVEVLEADDQLAGVGGVMEECGGVLKIQELKILPNFNFLYRSFLPDAYGPTYVDGIGTCNLLIKRHAFQGAGGFMEQLKRDEDNDLCLTLGGMGYKFYQDAETIVWHKCSQAGRQNGTFAHFRDPKLYLDDLLQTRIILVAKHAPWRLSILALLDLLFAPMILYRMKTGWYGSKRPIMAVPDKNRLTIVSFLLVKSIKYYMLGFNFFFRSLLGLRKAPDHIIMP
ncbi:MAG: glycosyltransferase family A protein [Desulfobaccales bacterium]